MSKKLEGKVAVVTGASKGIGASIAKALAEEGASQPGDDRNRGIACGGGFVGTDFQKAVEAQAPLGRMGQPDDIAPTAVYLASSDSKYMTGETLLVSGGLR